MTHDEADDFLMHYGKKGMKWGQRAAHPKFGERGQTDRQILDARAKYERLNPGLKANVKSARATYRQNRTADNKAALKTAKRARTELDNETYLRTVSTGREIARDLLISAGMYAAVKVAQNKLGA